MTPKNKSASPTIRRRYCGLGNHYLREPHKTITDAKILRFAKLINPELRNSTLLCSTCYETLEKIYRVKLRHAIQLQKSKKRALANTNSISDVSSSQQMHSSQNSQVVSGASSISESSETSSIDQQIPNESTKRKRSAQPSSTSDDDDDEPLLSLNAVNGTRLPNIQPIPKRRQFVHLNKDVMDIYLRGTTGG